ncbi:V-type ATPase subunit a family protein [Methanothermobacter sp. K4]|uniref:V-type ATPase subunit a family protein n=1 Tax=Methanothermobacter sp. K4 TaxID=2913262 RepID=UPI001EDB464A|nr:V-type ATPase subunit a family protein [Methanothermobacter sp. K4]MCG2827721.1 V-type ATPase subunit a family protein [Methanothermobacter sp. K4]
MKTARINVRVSEVDKETIKKSKYSYADAIEYFARLLRKKGIIPDLYVKALREELDEISEKKIELEKELERLNREEDRLKRELERFSEPVDEPMREVREAARFIMERIEERDGMVSPTEVVNDRGEDLIEVASRIYGAPEEEILKLLSEKGVPL